MNGKKPQGFFIYANRLSHISSMLSMAELGRLITALAVYFETGALPASRSRAFNACFEMLRSDVDRDIARYQEICERSRYLANRRWHPEESPPPAAMQDACTGMPAHANTTHPSSSHPSVNQLSANQLNANQPGAAKARTALTGNAVSSPLPAAKPSSVPARHTGDFSSSVSPTKKGETTHERAGHDPRFSRCTAI